MSTPPTLELFKALKDRLYAAADEHSPKVDSFWYNGGTVAVLACTTTATFLPADIPGYGWLPRALTGFATFWIALDRALDFGGRWRFHREMRNGYRGLVDRIDLYIAMWDSMSDEYRSRHYHELWSELRDLQYREGRVPGTQPVFRQDAEQHDRFGNGPPTAGVKD